MGTGSFRGVKSGPSVTLTPHPLLVPWSWNGRAIPLLPLWAVRPVQSLSACTRVHFTFTFMEVVVRHSKRILQNTLFLRPNYQMSLTLWFAVNFNMKSMESWSGFNRSAYNILVVKHVTKRTFGRPKYKWTVKNKDVRIYTRFTWLELGTSNKLWPSQAINLFSRWELLLQFKETQDFGENEVTDVYRDRFWARFCVHFSAFPVRWWICIVANFTVGSIKM